MIGNKYLLDTNIVSAYFKGEVSVGNNIDLHDEIFIPVIVIGELSFGAALSNDPSRYLYDIEMAKNIFNIISVNTNTCSYYGSIKANLRKKGKPIPENDIWIAAIALQHNLTLTTRDNHFKEVDGLLTEEW